MSSLVVDGVCTFGDLPPDQCGHCRGITAVDLERVSVAHLLAPDPEWEPMARTMAREVMRRQPLEKLARIVLRSVDVYAQLEDALHGTRGAGEGDRVSGGGGDDRPMPLQHQVAEHRHLLVRGLRYWRTRVGVVADRRPLDTVPDLVAVILGHLDRLDDADQAELQANMLDWQRRARILTDLPQLRGTIPLGACCPNRDSELWSCTGTLLVLLPADKGNAVALRCADCGGRWDVADLPAAANVRLSIADAAAVTHTSVRTLQYRVQHGSLPARAGRVRLGDVLRSECAL